MRDPSISADSLATFMRTLYETPAGLLVSGQSMESLVKAEADKRQVEDNRTRFFSMLSQNLVAWGAREKPAGTPSFAALRMAARESFIDRIIIQSRVNQHKTVWQRAMDEKQIGFQVVHDRHNDPSYKVTSSDRERCEEMMQLVANPTPVAYLSMYPHGVRPHRSLKEFSAVMARAELTIDRKAMQRYRRRDGEGYAAFHWIPGDTIKNVDEAIKAWAEKNEPTKRVGTFTVEKMSNALSIDIGSCAYVQMTDGMIVRGFSEDEISVHVSNPSDELNRWGYGESNLEISLDVTSMLLKAWQYNKDLFSSKLPDTLLRVGGKGVDKEGLLAFKQQLYAEVGNMKYPVIDGSESDFNIEAVKIKDSPKDMLFDQLLRMAIMLKAAAYGAHPSILNFAMDNGTSSPLSTHDPGTEIEAAKDNSFKPQLLDFCDWLTEDLIKPRYDDLRLIIVGLEREDEKQVVELRTQRSKGWISRNDIRMEEGKLPRGFWTEDEKYQALSDEDKLKYDGNPWNLPADQPLASQQLTLAQLSAPQEEDEEATEEPVQKSRKFLEITLED